MNNDTVNINYGFNKKNPCTGACTKRALGCHSTCQAYIDWKNALVEYKKRIRQKNYNAKNYWIY